jgi:hypothetical protein
MRSFLGAKSSSEFFVQYIGPDLDFIVTYKSLQKGTRSMRRARGSSPAANDHATEATQLGSAMQPALQPTSSIRTRTVGWFACFANVPERREANQAPRTDGTPKGTL